MNRLNVLTLAVTGLLATAVPAVCHAQHVIHPYGSGFGHHDGWRNHVVRDRHGHVLGRYHPGVIHNDATCIVPHFGHYHDGSYYVHEGRYYYSAHTLSAGPVANGVVAEEVTFGGFSHVDDLAFRLETLANELCLDLFYNYSHNPDFRVTYTEAYQVLETARFIHDAEHQQDRAAIQQQLGGLDALFHHVQDDVRGWTRHHRQQFGDRGILSKMELLESTLHHLMNDVGVRLAPTSDEQAPPPESLGVPPVPEQAPAPLVLPTEVAS